jgi:hypothetical protein
MMQKRRTSDYKNIAAFVNSNLSKLRMSQNTALRRILGMEDVPLGWINVYDVELRIL